MLILEIMRARKSKRVRNQNEKYNQEIFKNIK